MNFPSIKQATVLKIAAVSIAIPRFAGAFALSVGYAANGDLHAWLGIAEVIAGLAMGVLEGFAFAFILNKWRLLKPSMNVAQAENDLAQGWLKQLEALLTSSLVSWMSLLIVSLLLAVSLPLVAVPYLYFAQNGYTSASELFANHLGLQIAWNFVVAGVPMLIVIGVGLADVDELEREERELDYKLNVRKRSAMVELELSKLELEIEQAKVADELSMSKLKLDVERAQAINELEIKKLRAQFKLESSNVEAKTKQNISLPYACDSCSESFAGERQLSGHKAHCKGRLNGKVESYDELKVL